MSDSLVSRLRTVAPGLAPRLADAARYVADNPFDAASSPMRELARRTNQAPTTFTRLARTLGFDGWEALRAELIAKTRQDLEAAQEAPYSNRLAPFAGQDSLAAQMLAADVDNIARIDPVALNVAAERIERAERVLVAGFRSCHAPAVLLHYLYRLFRLEVSLIGGPGGILDLDLGGLRRGDLVVLFGFAPYSRDGLLTAQSAVRSGGGLVAIVDRPDAPLAQGADAVLTFGAESPSYFPSLTACTALVQALAATLYVRSGEQGRERLRETEARIAAHTAYIRQDGGR